MLDSAIETDKLNRLPALPFSQREHVQLLHEAVGLGTEDLQKVKATLLEALQASSAKDIAVKGELGTGAYIQRVQEDLADHDVRLEAAEKLLKLFDLYPKKGQSITIERSQVVVNPKFVKRH